MSAAEKKQPVRFYGIGVEPDSDYVIYTFGAAGTGAALWGPFQERLSGLAEVRAARLPGRESRHRDAPVHSVANQIADLGPDLHELIDKDERPYLVVGLCWGTITAYEMCRYLQQTAPRPPTALVVGNDVAPAELGSQAVAVREYGKEQFRSWCTQNMRLPNELNDPNIFGFFEPMLRADITVAATYEHYQQPSLHCPVVSVCCDRSVAYKWKEATDGPFTVREIENPSQMDSLASVVAQMVS